MGRQQLEKQVVQSFRKLVNAQAVIAPIDLLRDLERLTKADVEAWRFRRVAYLEQKVVGNLSRLNFIFRTFQGLAATAGLKPSRTVYMSWGKGKKIPLRFTKYRDDNVEVAWSTHYVNSFLLQQKRTEKEAAGTGSAPAGAAAAPETRPPPPEHLPGGEAHAG